MYINEYGDRDDPAVILLAPMMVSGSDLYRLMSPYFRGSYHVIAPDQGGHGRSGPYVSAAAEYRELKAFLLETGCTRIRLVYGASLGAAVGWRLFLDPDLRVSRAWFDGTALCANARFAEWSMKRLFRSRKRKLARTGAAVSENLVRMYGYSFAKMMTENFRRITPEDIDAICRACCRYGLRELTAREQESLHLDFGSKDFDWRYARRTIPKFMPGAEVTLRPGYPHCGYMAAYPREYTEEVERFMNGGP